jgi:hypothetical protein
MAVQTPPPTFTPPAVPSRGRRPLLAVLVVLGVLGGAVVALGGAALATRDSVFEERQWEPTGVHALVVRTTAGDIDVTVEDRPDIALRSHLQSSLWNEATVTTELIDGTLTIVGDCDRGAANLGCSTAHTLAVPRGVLAELRAVTTAGDVAVDGPIDDTAELRTMAGDIAVDTSQAPRRLEAWTTAGDVTVSVPDDAYAVTTRTTAGEVDVRVTDDPDAARSIDVRTTAGDIVVDRG